MIIGTFNTDNTDPKKAVPSLETRWVPDWDGNDKLPEEEQAYIIGRYLRPGESLKYQSMEDGEFKPSATSWKYRELFRDTVQEIHGFYWKDAKTGEKHELTKEVALLLPVTAGNHMQGDNILFGWFQHVIAGERLNGDEVKNSGSDSKRSD